jgi:hypothetical protein
VNHRFCDRWGQDSGTDDGTWGQYAKGWVYRTLGFSRVAAYCGETQRRENNPGEWDGFFFNPLDILLSWATIESAITPLMNIEIRSASLQARIQKQLEATGSASVEEVLLRLLETQEEQDRWLQENKDAIDAKLRRGIAQLDRGEGIPEERVDAYLKELKAQSE